MLCHTQLCVLYALCYAIPSHALPNHIYVFELVICNDLPCRLDVPEVFRDAADLSHANVEVDVSIIPELVQQMDHDDDIETAT